MISKEKPSGEEAGKVDGCQFSWGLRLDTFHFYDSFTRDGVDYRLYDDVYLLRAGQAEPDVGKIVKMWRTVASNEKKVEVVWFFRPIEIDHWLGGIKPLPKEVFLGCGEGKGLSNVNDLDAIGGKCNVVCVSKDSRNFQPTQEELDNARYVYYRTFDVEKYNISEVFPSTIGGVEVDHFFNRRKDCGNPVTAGSKLKLKIKVGNLSSHPTLKTSLPSMKGSESARMEKGFKEPAAPSSRETNYLAKDRPPAGAKMENPKRLLPENSSAGGSTKKTKLLASSDPRDDALPDPQARIARIAKPFSAEESGREQHLSKKISYEYAEVTRRLGMGASTWLKLQCWDEERLLEAHQKGTLVLLENLDPTFTSAEVEDIVWHAFRQKVRAKMVQLTAFSTPHSGKALILFKSKEAADLVIQQLINGCLLLSDGRPIVGRRRLLRKPGVASGFIGHLSVERTRCQRQREDIANTIEYEMAIHWRALQAKSDLWCAALYEGQGREIDELMKQIKIHHLD